MDPVTLVLLIAALIAAWWVFTRRGARRTAATDETTDYLTPKPLKEPLQTADWDGYTGMQMALAVALADGRAYPVLQAGTEPPAARTLTFSTATAEQEYLPIAIYAGLSDEIHRMHLVQRISVGPIPLSAEGVREVLVTLLVDEDGAVSVQAELAEVGIPVAYTVTESSLGAIPIGRRSTS